MKRALTLILAVLTVFSLCAPAFASGEPAEQAPAEAPAAEPIEEVIPEEPEAPAEEPEAPAEEPEAPAEEPEAPAEEPEDVPAEPEIALEPEAEGTADEPETAAAKTATLQIVGGADNITITDESGKTVKDGGTLEVGKSYSFTIKSGYTLSDLVGATTWSNGQYDPPRGLWIDEGHSVSKVVVTLAPAVKLTVKGETDKIIERYVLTKPYTDDEAYYAFSVADVAPANREVEFHVMPGYEMTVSNGTIVAQDSGGMGDAGRFTMYTVRMPASGTMTATVKKAAGIPFTVKGSTGKVTVTDESGKAVKSGDTVLPGTLLRIKPSSGYAITGIDGLRPAYEQNTFEVGNLDGSTAKAATLTVGTGVKLSVTGSTSNFISAGYSISVGDNGVVYIDAGDTVAPGGEVTVTMDGDYTATVKNGNIGGEQYTLADPSQGTASKVLHTVWIGTPKSGTLTVNIAKSSTPAPKPIPLQFDDPEGLIGSGEKQYNAAALPGWFISFSASDKAKLTVDGGEVIDVFDIGDGIKVFNIAVSSSAKKVVVHASSSGTAQKNGLVTENGATYYYKNGVKQKGLVNAGSRVFYYCSTSDGHVLKGGWIKVNGANKYYADKDGQLYTGYCAIGSKNYYFSVNDAHLMKGGVVTGPGNKQYYVSAKDGHAMKGGWARGKNIKNSKTVSYYYYLDETGVVRVTKQLPTSTSISSLAIPSPSEYQN